MPKLYTKKGDKGNTSLYDGSVCSKSNPIFDLLGDLDELGSHIGLLCSKLGSYNGDKLREIQVKLLDIGSNIAVLDETKRKRVPKIESSDVEKIENWIDECEEKNGKLTEFLLLGVFTDDAQCHVCRSVSRRVERNMWKLNGMRYDVPNKEKYYIVDIDENILKYMNRLSDFFFALSRNLSDGHEIKVSDIKKKLSTI